jgi:hypothetical protein
MKGRVGAEHSIRMTLLLAFLKPDFLYGGWLALFCALMGALYCTSDIGENLALDRIFARGLPVDPCRAFRASGLTRAKFAFCYLALPALIGVAVKAVHDTSWANSDFTNGLTLAPSVVLLVAGVWPPFARALGLPD